MSCKTVQSDCCMLLRFQRKTILQTRKIISFHFRICIALWSSFRVRVGIWCTKCYSLDEFLIYEKWAKVTEISLGDVFQCISLAYTSPKKAFSKFHAKHSTFFAHFIFMTYFVQLFFCLFIPVLSLKPPRRKCNSRRHFEHINN